MTTLLPRIEAEPVRAWTLHPPILPNSDLPDFSTAHGQRVRAFVVRAGVWLAVILA